MTEDEWLQTEWLYPLLDYLEGKLHQWKLPDTAPKASDRKMRLFACSCCRRIWDFLDPDCRRAIEAAESFADGLADEELLLCWREVTLERLSAVEKPLVGVDLYLIYLSTLPIAASADMLELDDRYLRECGHNPEQARAIYAASWPVSAVVHATSQVWPKLYHHGYGYGTTQAQRQVARTLAGPFPSEIEAVRRWHKAVGREVEQHTKLLRHIVGNPFRPYAVPSFWPSTVVQLAVALYHGENCGFALHDALLKSWHPDLADHFRQEQHHPKGCWIVDLLLGKE